MDAANWPFFPFLEEVEPSVKMKRKVWSQLPVDMQRSIIGHLFAYPAVGLVSKQWCLFQRIAKLQHQFLTHPSYVIPQQVEGTVLHFDCLLPRITFLTLHRFKLLHSIEFFDVNKEPEQQPLPYHLAPRFLVTDMRLEAGKKQIVYFSHKSLQCYGDTTISFEDESSSTREGSILVENASDLSPSSDQGLIAHFDSASETLSVYNKYSRKCFYSLNFSSYIDRVASGADQRVLHRKWHTVNRHFMAACMIVSGQAILLIDHFGKAAPVVGKFDSIPERIISNERHIVLEWNANSFIVMTWKEIKDGKSLWRKYKFILPSTTEIGLFAVGNHALAVVSKDKPKVVQFWDITLAKLLFEKEFEAEVSLLFYKEQKKRNYFAASLWNRTIYCIGL